MDTGSASGCQKCHVHRCLCFVPVCCCVCTSACVCASRLLSHTALRCALVPMLLYAHCNLMSLTYCALHRTFSRVHRTVLTPRVLIYNASTISSSSSSLRLTICNTAASLAASVDRCTLPHICFTHRAHTPRKHSATPRQRQSRAECSHEVSNKSHALFDSNKLTHPSHSHFTALSFSLSLSLSHTHTHTHTGAGRALCALKQERASQNKAHTPRLDKIEHTIPSALT